MQAMIRIYCDGHHPGRGLCTECAALAAYAGQRLEKCPFQDEKATCARCAVHCYKQDMRERVRMVMKYAGPRILWRHPVLALLHLRDERRPASPSPTAA